ncbi:alpha-glucosidase [Mesorhizobium sp. WSM1497]|uniref:alpha-amylase family glycosyl hydrolase n=1 Tax=Mesorhizobium sp. WSM1497 TaxID=278153 RepID=UPI0007ECD832|nr:alpha-amylase family glycosyl hydrolase [Mesorhizobium sp. WSM1497]ARP64322.1 alpha-glucosidase [Mesorhizobium sp. WSM1497]
MTVHDDEWWRSAVIYMVYIRSFRDGNGDGIGDLPGLLGGVDYIASLGVDAVWISPFFRSPMKDFGYDVADYRDVDPIFGTMADFDAVLAAFHARNIRVLLDLVVSHTSDQHDWFRESRVSRSSPRADWYVWADPRPDGSPPSNWLSLFGGSAWQWEPQRGQYYLHNFLRSQPDLNYHTEDVQQAVLDVFEFWLRRGVDGFRLDVVNFYVHDRHLRDNPPVPADADLSTVPVSNPYGHQLHLHDKNQPENLVFLSRLRALMRRYGDAFLLGELGVDEDVPEWTRRYTQAGERLHTAYTFELLAAKEADPVHIRQVVSAMDRGMGDGWTAWSLSNLDNPRVVSRWHAEDCPDRAAPLFIALLATFRGTTCLYQGEELGFEDAPVAFEDLQDAYGLEFWPVYTGRDGCRTPMAWTSQAPFGGFSKHSPWLPVDPRHIARSVERQGESAGSSLNRLRRFLSWRQAQPEFHVGSMRFLDVPAPLLAVARETEHGSLIGIFNLGPAGVELTLAGLAGAKAAAGHGFSGHFEQGRVQLDGYDATYLRVGRQGDLTDGQG